MHYESHIHTPDSLQDQLDTIQSRNIDTRIVGSLGRSVLFGMLANNPELEYESRNQNPLYDHTGQARDIDVIGVSSTAETGSYPVDAIAFDNKEVSVWKEGSDWWLKSENKNFAEQLHPDVIAPVQGTGALDLDTVTVPLQTHIALTLARGVPRKKDDVAIRLLEEAGQRDPHPLPNSLYKPFRDLSSISQESSLLTPSSLYRRLLPDKAKRIMDPLLKSAGIITSKGLHEDD